VVAVGERQPGLWKRIVAFITDDSDPRPGTDLVGFRPFPVLYTATSVVLELISVAAALVGMIFGIWPLATAGWFGIVAVMAWGARCARDEGSRDGGPRRWPGVTRSAGMDDKQRSERATRE
jgi:hypothetical protein